MDITFLRSSFLSSIKYCELKTYIVYGLGYVDAPNPKTVLGTIAHKSLEILALLKKEYQRTGEKVIQIEDDSMGTYVVHYDDLMSEDWLTQEEIDKINKTRVNKSTYGPNSPGYRESIQLTFPHCQYGRAIVNQIIEDCYEYYKERTPEFDWPAVSLKDVRNFVWIALDHQNGTFDPRKREIFGTEQSFEIALEDSWATYEYESNGDQICGQLKIKGTIDLILKIDDDTLEILDWKSGQRIDWANGDVKSLEKLQKDPQLMLYYYALRKLFPQYKNVILSIFFLRDGGPFSVCFEDHHIDVMHNYIKETFHKVQKMENPQMLDPTQKDFRCFRLCGFYKQAHGDTNFCKHIHESIKNIGIDAVTELYKKQNFNIDHYQSPGE